MCIELQYSIIPTIQGGEFIFAETVTDTFSDEVNLTTDRRYEVWLVERGAERVTVLVHKGPDVVFDETFTLMHRERDYLPYLPEFTVRENATYQVHVKALEGGVRAGIRGYPL